MNRRTTASRVAALIGSLGLAACSGRGKGEAKPEAPEAPGTVRLSAAQIEHGGVRWSAASAETLVPSLELPGQLVPDEDRTARLGAPAEGRILSVSVRVGDRVRRGQTLAVLQSTAGEAARADLVKAGADLASKRAALAYARSARERAERLLQAKAAAKQDLDRARADEEFATSAFTAAEAELARARAAADQLGISAESGDLRIRSPLDAAVIARDAIPGTAVAPGSVLVTVTNLATLWLEVAAPDSAAEALRPGARVRFTVAAIPGTTFEARIDSVGGSLDPQTRTLPVRATVGNASGRLRPNMFAAVLLEAGPAKPAVAVPDGAVVLMDQRPVVFVATPEAGGGARFESRTVEVGRKHSGRTLVTGGVRPGENVVTEGAFAIKSQLERSQMPAEG